MKLRNKNEQGLKLRKTMDIRYVESIYVWLNNYLN